jgi:hypothetical protein
VVLLGIIMPLFVTHTAFGVWSFFKADLIACRSNYDGEVFYIIILMFQVSMSFVFILLTFCVMVPLWIERFQRRRRAAYLA